MRRPLAQVLTAALLFVGSLSATGAAGAVGADSGGRPAPPWGRA
ncbi:hypothetical protein ACFRKE_01770 [Kitasatospora indigofera]